MFTPKIAGSQWSSGAFSKAVVSLAQTQPFPPKWCLCEVEERLFKMHEWSRVGTQTLSLILSRLYLGYSFTAILAVMHLFVFEWPCMRWRLSLIIYYQWCSSGILWGWNSQAGPTTRECYNRRRWLQWRAKFLGSSFPHRPVPALQEDQVPFDTDHVIIPNHSQGRKKACCSLVRPMGKK